MSSKSGAEKLLVHALLSGFLVLSFLGTASASNPTLTPQEKTLCLDVCQKQLGCAGQANNRSIMSQCAAGCETALGMRDPFASKPWLVAYRCVSKACGNSYSSCIAKKMSEPTPSERTCTAICGKRLGCNGEITDPNARNACQRSCVVNLDAVGSPGHAFESATSQCLKKKCGLPLEACVAKKLGGLNATCADVCKQRVTCAGTPTSRAFAECMPRCFQEVQNPRAAPRVNAELACPRRCGLKREECIAKQLGGHYPMCHRVCAKQLLCGGAGDNISALYQCQNACLREMVSGNSQGQLSFRAVDGCIRQRCGNRFNSCVSSALQIATKPARPAPVAPSPVQSPPIRSAPIQPAPTTTVPPTPVQPAPRVRPTPVQPAPVITPTRPSRAERRCEELCRKLESCVPGSATGCTTRCLNDRSSTAEFTAIDRCKTQGCGRGFDGCMLRRMGVSKSDRACMPLCQKEYQCRNPGKLLSYPALAACTNGCTRSNLEIKAGNKCANHACGSDYDQCMTVASRRPPTRKEQRCKAVCDKASECSSLPDRAKCFDRCVNEKSSRTEMRMRELCASSSCEKYESCLLDGLRVPRAKQKCVAVCRHDMMCNSSGAAVDIVALAKCARSCNKPKAQVEAISACAPAGCDTAFRICVESKLKAIASVPPPPKKLSRKEKKCKATCDKMETCAPGTGGEACMNKCLSGRSKREFDARGQCNAAKCGEYTVCLAKALGVPRRKLACVDACSHELSCLPPGEPRGLNQLIRCARRCKHTPKMIEAIGMCQVKGCGGAFKVCVASKTGALAKKKELRSKCEAYCKSDVDCRRSRSSDACVQRCVETGATSSEFSARRSCQSSSCDEWDQCIMDSMKVSARGRRCLDACRWDLQCARGGDQSGQLSKLATCMNTCRYTEKELSIRTDCEFEGCGSKFKMCVEKGLSTSTPGTPSRSDGVNATP